MFHVDKPRFMTCLRQDGLQHEKSDSLHVLPPPRPQPQYKGTFLPALALIVSTGCAAQLLNMNIISEAIRLCHSQAQCNKSEMKLFEMELQMKIMALKLIQQQKAK